MSFGKSFSDAFYRSVSVTLKSTATKGAGVFLGFSLMAETFFLAGFGLACLLIVVSCEGFVMKLGSGISLRLVIFSYIFSLR